MEFKIIDYNKCTFNKIIHGEQCAIQFHVDNLKLSYMEQGVFTGKNQNFTFLPGTHD